VITRIHVNQHVIRRKKIGGDEPPLSVKQNGKVTPARFVKINGPSIVVYMPDHPLSCGARVWIETTAPVEVTP
jgi:hypothetical protein